MLLSVLPWSVLVSGAVTLPVVPLRERVVGHRERTSIALQVHWKIQEGRLNRLQDLMQKMPVVRKKLIKNENDSFSLDVQSTHEQGIRLVDWIDQELIPNLSAEVRNEVIPMREQAQQSLDAFFNAFENGASTYQWHDVQKLGSLRKVAQQAILDEVDSLMKETKSAATG